MSICGMITVSVRAPAPVGSFAHSITLTPRADHEERSLLTFAPEHLCRREGDRAFKQCKRPFGKILLQKAHAQEVYRFRVAGVLSEDLLIDGASAGDVAVALQDKRLAHLVEKGGRGGRHAPSVRWAWEARL